MRKLAFCGILTILLASTNLHGQDDAKRKGRNSQRPGSPNLERMLQALDKNKDGKIDQSEAPERMKSRFAQMDLNKDGSIDGDELKKIFARRNQADGKSKSGKGRPDTAAGKASDRPAPARGRGLDLASLFKEGDKDGDGNLNPAEQKAIIAKFNEMMNRFRQMRGKADGKQKSDRLNKPNTDPVKPKRPGK